MYKIIFSLLFLAASFWGFAEEKKYQIPPQDLNWITPYLVVKSVEESIDFYSKVFLFNVHQTVPNAQGKLIFARIRYNGSNIILGPPQTWGEKELGLPPALSHTKSPVAVYIYCDNLKERWAKVLEAKVKVLIEPTVRFWGDTIFRVEDLNGYIWTFAQPTHDFNPDLIPNEWK